MSLRSFADRYVLESLEFLPEWNAWLGYQFENFIINNTNELFERLHLGGIPILSAAPYVKCGKKCETAFRSHRF